jgi:hypothetical protein
MPLISMGRRYVTGGGGGGGFATYAASDNPASQSTGTSTATFNGVNIGTAASNRVVVVISSCESNVGTAVTIGGISASLAIGESTGVSSLQIWYATVPTGTTATIIHTAAGNAIQQVIQVGYFYSGASTTPSNTNSIGQGTSPQSLAVTVPTGGFGVFGGYATTNVSVAWSGTNVISDFITSTPNGSSLGSAHDATSGSQTATFSDGISALNHLVAASWGP